MKVKYLFLIAFLTTFINYGQTADCGSVINETFDVDGVLSGGWTEYQTSGRVTVSDGQLKLDYTTDKPAVFKSFNPVNENFSYAFDIGSTRNYVNCTMDLISSSGAYLASFTFALLSNKSIQYASSMDNGIPSSYTGALIPSTYLTNTMYTISMSADFTTQKINIYNDGVLMAENISFLENVQDIAKVDIQLNYMYSNEGRFFFDNISLTNAQQNRVDLQNALTAGQTFLDGRVVGDKFNQYAQTDIDNFQSAIDNANLILSNCGASSSDIDNALSNFLTAKSTFENRRINNPVLKIYENQYFTGNEHEIYCGYYNGTLGSYEDWASSFTLDRGYMVTFAENINGTGASKVYIASDEDLRINLPDILQDNISFIRVSPWNDVQKKGLGAKGDDVVAVLNNSWYYNWGTTGEAIGNAEFVPNQWGGGTIDKAVSLGERMDITHYMAFNEPGNSDQSNMTVDNAILKYQNMLASGLRLGSPANQDNANGGNWRDEFLTKAKENGLRIDYIVVHYYKRTTPANFYNWLKAIHDEWQLPIWIKEFNYGATWISNKPATNQAASDGLQSYINMLDGTSFVERYAVFTWQPDEEEYSLMSVRNPLSLSASGIMYRDHSSPVAYTQETYEGSQSLSVELHSFENKNRVEFLLVEEGVLNIVYADNVQERIIELLIYSSLGGLVKEVSGNLSRVDVSSLTKGVYVVKMKSDLGIYVQKIIIK